MPGSAPTPPPGLGGGMPGAQPPGMGGPMAQSNPGNALAGIMKVRQAIKLLEETLAMVPMESPLHEKILTSVKSLLQAMPDESPDMAGPQQTNLLQIFRNAAQQAPLQALGQAGGAGGAPGGGAPSSPAGPMAAAA